MHSLHHSCITSLEILCNQIGNRSVGSQGNRAATRYFEEVVSALGWQIETQEFDAMDWIDGGASLRLGDASFEVFTSPYSLSCEVNAQLVSASNLDELEKTPLTGKALLLHGEIATEQLMPKNFVFYNPAEHQHIIALLEKNAPAAIICATGRNAALAGGVYPFPLIEDGDFNIPSVYMTDVEGARLLPCTGQIVSLRSDSRRITGKGYNVIARIGNPDGRRIVFTAHIDAKKGTPGAIDNASGVVVLLLLGELLKDYRGDLLLELVAFNGEDYYAVPGQMLYLQHNQGRFEEILLNINLDGAGYKDGDSAFSFYGLPEPVEKQMRAVMGQYSGISQGPQWVQGDHSIFIQNGCPAVAVSSCWFTEHIDAQDITHTPKDNLAIVDPAKLVEIARALELFIRNMHP